MRHARARRQCRQSARQLPAPGYFRCRLVSALSSSFQYQPPYRSRFRSIRQKDIAAFISPLSTGTGWPHHAPPGDRSRQRLPRTFFRPASRRRKIFSQAADFVRTAGVSFSRTLAAFISFPPAAAMATPLDCRGRRASRYFFTYRVFAHADSRPRQRVYSMSANSHRRSRPYFTAFQAWRRQSHVMSQPRACASSRHAKNF